MEPTPSSRGQYCFARTLCCGRHVHRIRCEFRPWLPVCPTLTNVSAPCSGFCKVWRQSAFPHQGVGFTLDIACGRRIAMVAWPRTRSIAEDTGIPSSANRRGRPPRDAFGRMGAYRATGSQHRPDGVRLRSASSHAACPGPRAKEGTPGNCSSILIVNELFRVRARNDILERGLSAAGNHQDRGSSFAEIPFQLLRLFFGVQRTLRSRT